MALVVERFPAFRIGTVQTGIALIDQDRTAGEGFPILLEDLRGVTGIDPDVLRIQDNRTVGTESFLRGGGAGDESVVLDEGDVREAVHIEITAVDAGEGLILQAQGAGAVGLLPLGGDDGGLESVRIVSDKGDELAFGRQGAVETVGFRGLADREFAAGPEIEYLFNPFGDVIHRLAAGGQEGEGDESPFRTVVIHRSDTFR